MRSLLFLLILPLCVAMPQPVLVAGWGAGGCAPVGASVGIDAPYEWRQCADDSDCWALYRGGVQVGGYRASNGRFSYLVGGQWAEPCEAPIALPIVPAAKKDSCPCCGDDCRCGLGRPCDRPNCRCVLPGAVVESDGSLNFGLDREAMAHAPRHIHNGKRVSKQQLLQAIEKAALRDDSGELCLTVIGPEAARKPVLTDLDSAAALSPWKGRIKVKGFAPDHWAVRDSGFVTSGNPTIYCQAADGKVLHRQDDYRGAEALAEALRKADPNYQPAKDPDLTKPALAVPSMDDFGKLLREVPAWAWVALAFLVYLRFFHKEKAR